MHTNHACNQESYKLELFRTCGNEITGGSEPGLQLVEKLVCAHSNLQKMVSFPFYELPIIPFVPSSSPKFCIMCLVLNFSHSYDSCKSQEELESTYVR